jgi:hypothetical protein
VPAVQRKKPARESRKLLASYKSGRYKKEKERHFFIFVMCSLLVWRAYKSKRGSNFKFLLKQEQRERKVNLRQPNRDEWKEVRLPPRVQLAATA